MIQNIDCIYIKISGEFIFLKKCPTKREEQMSDEF
jgi:hypothetical protein